MTLTLHLMNFTGNYVTEVEVEENTQITIQIISGDWVLTSPEHIDTADFGIRRVADCLDHIATFKATPSNIDRLNNLDDPYALIPLSITFKREEKNISLPNDQSHEE